MKTRVAPGVVGGRYRLHGLLGEGGMARVFDAFDEHLQRRVAVKLLRPETLALPGMRGRFQQEARIAARLTHPNIVAILDDGEDSSGSYLVMECLPGTTLRDEIASGPLPDDRVILVLSEILSALSTAHRSGVVHRDIKPSNILVQENGHTKLSDFGIAKTLEVGSGPGRWHDDVTLTGVVLGTPGYLAPERRSGLPATVQSDLYSVGAVMAEALTRVRPVPGYDGNEHLPHPFRGVLRGAMAANPDDRFGSAEEMLQALRTLPTAPGPGTRPGGTARLTSTATAPSVRRSLGGPGTDGPPPSPFPQPRSGRSRPRRHRAFLVAVGVATLVVALFLMLDTGSQRTGPAATGSSHHARLTEEQGSDPEQAAIKALATALAGGGFSGDIALAHALTAVAAQPPGGARQAAAQRALSLAQTLLDSGDITSGQDQDVASVLQGAGAIAPPSSPAISTTLPPTAPAPHLPDHGDGHGGGDGHGQQNGADDQD